MSSVDVEYGAQMEREAQRYKAQRDEAIRRAEQRIAELEQENERLQAELKAQAEAHRNDVLCAEQNFERAERAEQLCEQLVEAKNLIEQRKLEAEQRIAELQAENERLSATNDINAHATLGHCLRAQAAEQRIAEVEQQLAEARAVLAEVEWSARVPSGASGSQAGCPVCGEPKADFYTGYAGKETGRHANDCRLAAILKETS